MPTCTWSSRIKLCFDWPSSAIQKEPSQGNVKTSSSASQMKCQRKQSYQETPGLLWRWKSHLSTVACCLLSWWTNQERHPGQHMDLAQGNLGWRQRACRKGKQEFSFYLKADRDIENHHHQLPGRSCSGPSWTPLLWKSRQMKRTSTQLTQWHPRPP